jgi:hypothetical protein
MHPVLGGGEKFSLFTRGRRPSLIVQCRQTLTKKMRQIILNILPEEYPKLVLRTLITLEYLGATEKEKRGK